MKPHAAQPSATPTVTRTRSNTPTPIVPPVNGEIVIDYVYDPLYRLTEANYSTGDFYHYTYDQVGNRLTQDSNAGGLPSTVSYQYDNANRLTSAGGVTYVFDNNGNLLNDGTNTYTYDSANRLTSVNGTTSYAYNGMGDRYQQTAGGQTTTYVLDLNAGISQVLDDGTNTYTYGLGRISQKHASVTEYFLGDALGSVRQLTNQSTEITHAGSFDPYGNVASTSGSSGSPYGYTGEITDETGLVYLRARYYNPIIGAFQSKDSWNGNANKPLSFNHWNYTFSNPVNFRDPTGFSPTGVDCNQINSVLKRMRELCWVANGDLSDGSQRYQVLYAREEFFREIAKISTDAGSAFGEGYKWAGILLNKFLDGATYVEVPLTSNSSFQSDRGILRATKLKLPQSSDDAKDITPLLHVFLNYIKSEGICEGAIPDQSYIGTDHYTQGSPRASDTGWWGAFGHVNIDATYTNSKIFQRGYGYYITTFVQYTVNDNYAWGGKQGTPLPLGQWHFPPLWELDGVRKIIGSVTIPHAWEVSLVDYGFAYEFDYKITWSEQLEIIVPPTFSSFYTGGLHDNLKD